MDIVEESNKTLIRLENNDPEMTAVSVINRDHSPRHNIKSNGCFWLHDGADLSRLGNAIGHNTHLESISLHKSSEWTRDSRPLFEGIQQNTTMIYLWLEGGIGNEISSMNIRNLSDMICIYRCDLRGGVAGALVPCIKKCHKLKQIEILNCDIDDDSLNDIASGVRGLSSLQTLFLWRRRSSDSIGIEGSEALASVLKDPNCNLTNLQLLLTGFNDESTTKIVSSFFVR